MERCKSENWGMGNGKTLFMSDEEKHGHHFDLQLFFNISKQFLAPGGLSADCCVFKLVSCKPEASRELALRPQGLRSLTFSKLVFSYVIVINRKKCNFVGF